MLVSLAASIVPLLHAHSGLQQVLLALMGFFCSTATARRNTAPRNGYVPLRMYCGLALLRGWEALPPRTRKHWCVRCVETHTFNVAIVELSFFPFLIYKNHWECPLSTLCQRLIRQNKERRCNLSPVGRHKIDAVRLEANKGRTQKAFAKQQMILSYPRS